MNSVPSGREIFFVILLGISGTFCFFRLMLCDLKTEKARTEYWVVRDTANRLQLKKDTAVDTLKLVFHPQVGPHRDSISKALKRGKITVAKLHYIGYDKLYFAYNSVFLVWIAFGALLSGFAMALAPVIIRTIMGLIAVFNLSKRQVLTASGITLGIGVVMYLTDKSEYIVGTVPLVRILQILVQTPWLLTVFILISMVVGLMAFTGQLLINSAIGSLPDSAVGLGAPALEVLGRKFQLLRNKLKFFLLVDSVLIVFSVLTTDAFRRAIAAEVTVNMELIPQNFVYLYGIMFTFYLGILYIPVYSRLKAKGEQLVGELPQPTPRNGLKRIFDILEIQQTPVENLQVALSILAPILTSLAPGLLKL